MRTPFLHRALAATAALMAATLVSCAPGDAPTGPDLGAADAARIHGRPPFAGRPIASLPVEAEEVSAVFDRRGGELKAGGHMISVGGGVVTVPTLFTMRVVDDGYVHVELDAYEADESGAFTVDVGTRGFRRPVVLKMDFSRAVVEDSERLGVSWLQDEAVDGRLVPQPSVVDASNRWVIARLTHFSGYILSGN